VLHTLSLSYSPRLHYPDSIITRQDKLVLVLNYALRHEDLSGSGVVVPRMQTSAPDGEERSGSHTGNFIPWGINTFCPLDGLGGPQSRYGRGGEEKNSQPLPGLEPRSSSP